MRLEMGNIYIKDIQFADTSKIEDGILYVDKGAVTVSYTHLTLPTIA